MLDLLDSLVDRSLVLVDEIAEGLRYRMLETMREYAREKLAASGELTAIRNQHRDWYLQLAEQIEVEILRSGQEAALLTRLESELDNFRAVLAWCFEAVDSGQWLVDSATEPASKQDLAVSESTTIHQPPTTAAEAGLRLANALCWVSMSRGHLAEGQQWLEAALARSQEAPARCAPRRCSARRIWPIPGATGTGG